jgi:hypothetical protein
MGGKGRGGEHYHNEGLMMRWYLTLGSVSSLNNLQNSEIFFWKIYEVNMLKIIIIIYSRLHSE